MNTTDQDLIRAQVRETYAKVAADDDVSVIAASITAEKGKRESCC